MIGVRHTGIVVNNLERSLIFYERLGFTVDKQMEESGRPLDVALCCPSVKITTVKMKAPDGTQIELLKFHTPWRKNSPYRELWDIGISHIALTVEDVDYLYGILLGLGVRFISQPQLSPDEQYKFVFCCDPDSNYLELVQENANLNTQYRNSSVRPGGHGPVLR